MPLQHAIRPDRESLVAALAARRLDRTLTTAIPTHDPQDEYAIGPTGVAGLDARLGGGLPRGQLSEIVGPRSSGRASAMLRMMSAATARGEIVALVDALDMFDVESAVAAGVDLDRLLWIRGHVVINPGMCRDMNQRAMEQAIRALTLVLQAGTIGLVIFDVAEAPVDALRRLPFTTWLRLQKMVEGRQTMCVLVGREPMARSSAGLTMRLRPSEREDEQVRARASSLERGGGGAPPPVEKSRSPQIRCSDRLFDGLEVETRVIRARVRMYEDTVASFSTEARYV